MFNREIKEINKFNLTIEATKMDKRLMIADQNFNEVQCWMKQNLSEEKRLEFMSMLNKHAIRLQTLNFK